MLIQRIAHIIAGRRAKKDRIANSNTVDPRSIEVIENWNCNKQQVQGHM